jgi:hypothetical protein
MRIMAGGIRLQSVISYYQILDDAERNPHRLHIASYRHAII